MTTIFPRRVVAQLIEREAMNPEVAGTNPRFSFSFFFFFFKPAGCFLQICGQIQSKGVLLATESNFSHFCESVVFESDRKVLEHKRETGCV